MVRTLIQQAHRVPGRVYVVVGVIVAAAIVWLVHARLAHARSACETALHAGGREAVAICTDSYRRSHSERDLDLTAQAAQQAGDGEQTERLARMLLNGRFRGDAHMMLSHVAFERGDNRDAADHAATAFSIHVLAGELSAASRDAEALANVARQVGDFTAALAAADEAVTLNRRRDDTRGRIYAAIAYADILRRIGATQDARLVLSDAGRVAAQPCDRAWVELKLAMTHMESEQPGPATDELRKAAAANQVCGLEEVADSIAANEAMLLRRRDPAAARARIAALLRKDGMQADLLLLRSYLEADRGALAEAAADLDRAAEIDPLDPDWPWEIANARAELALLRGGPFGELLAELHYRRAIAMVRELRSHARARSAFLVASHRASYDGLIALLASHGRWRDALALVIELDASDMLRATGNAVDGGAVDRGGQGVAMSAAAAAAPAAPSVDALLAAWRGRDLVIAIAPPRRSIAPGSERFYRLRIAEGAVTGEAVGDAGQANALAAQLHFKPDDRAAGAALGAMMVPPGTARETLYVLAIGALGNAPLSALRDADGAQVLARRPLVRVLALSASGPETTGAGGDAILADPDGDLPGAAEEGSRVADALGPRARIAGAEWPLQADRAQLWAARDAALLHLAGHVDRRNRTLLLADGEVTADEIIQHGVAPRLAVLAGCGSQAVFDDEGWGSIAAAMLVSGTAAVIATDRSVGDATALAVMRAFYARPDWRSDPERALAAVQVAFDNQPPPDVARTPEAKQSWMAFSVLRRPPVVPR